MIDSSQRLAIIQRVSDQWEKEIAYSVRPDPRYSVPGESQYPEGVVQLSATVAQHDELVRRIEEAVAEANASLD